MDQVNNEYLILREEYASRSTRSHSKKLRKGRCFESPVVSRKPTGFLIHQRLSWTKRAPLTPLHFPTLSSKQKQCPAPACHLTLNMPPKRPATSPAMSPSIAKKTRKSFTLEVKLDIIHRHERGEKTNGIAHNHGLTTSSVSTIFKSADPIKKAGEIVSSLQANRTT
ncbi:CENPB DNA-binding domain-containing protein 1 [Portunus trituberculatus]|uniref:CENPB DNA-binding domain-containing protein 1 n=1 Tax=Portunus trituberculatus TaxID=210409 RepID=A0A5B7EZW8_PORTR|nr:CENPB DNA-binding domain-containing protein 1 [Portunus trituberculatus]